VLFISSNFNPTKLKLAYKEYDTGILSFCYIYINKKGQVMIPDPSIFIVDTIN